MGIPPPCQPPQGAGAVGGWSTGNVPGVGGPPVGIFLLNYSKSGSLVFSLQQKFSLVHAPLSHHGSSREKKLQSKKVHSEIKCHDH